MMRFGSTAVLDEHLKRTLKLFGAFAAGPFLISFIWSWSAGVGFLFFLLGVPSLLIAVAIFGVVAIVQGVRLARQSDASRGERAAHALAAPTMLALFLLASLHLFAAGSFAGTHARLIVNQRHYEAIIAKANRGQRSPSRTAPAYEEYRGITYIVDKGPPLRVAFNPEGILDNWSGIVFDPTHDVMLADGFDAEGKFFAPDRVTELFDGDLVSCRPLWGDYYHCSFT